MMDMCNGGNTKLSISALSHVWSCVHGAGTSIQLKLWEGPHRTVTNLNDCTRTWRSGWVRRSPLWKQNQMEQKWNVDWKRPNLRKPRLGTQPEVSSDQFSLVHYLMPRVKNYFSIYKPREAIISCKGLPYRKSYYVVWQRVTQKTRIFLLHCSWDFLKLWSLRQKRHHKWHIWLPKCL